MKSKEKKNNQINFTLLTSFLLNFCVGTNTQMTAKEDRKVTKIFL